MTPFTLNKTISNFAYLAYWKKPSWLRLICKITVKYCLALMSPQETKEFIDFIVDEEVKKGGA